MLPIPLLLGFFGKHWEKLVIAGLVIAVLGFVYVTGRKHERNIWKPKYEAVVEASKTAEIQAKAERDTQARQAEESKERIVAHYQERVHAGNAALDSALARLRNATNRRPLQQASAAPAACRDYEADATQLSVSDGEFLIREAARADRAVERLASCQRYAIELHGVCSQ
jgi:signal recognition particle subunit SEC65